MCHLVEWTIIYRDGSRRPQQEIRLCNRARDGQPCSRLNRIQMNDEHRRNEYPPLAEPAMVAEIQEIQPRPNSGVLQSRPVSGVPAHVQFASQEAAGPPPQPTTGPGKKTLTRKAGRRGLHIDVEWHIPFTSRKPKPKKQPAVRISHEPQRPATATGLPTGPPYGSPCAARPGSYFPPHGQSGPGIFGQPHPGMHGSAHQDTHGPSGSGIYQPYHAGDGSIPPPPPAPPAPTTFPPTPTSARDPHIVQITPRSSRSGGLGSHSRSHSGQSGQSGPAHVQTIAPERATRRRSSLRVAHSSSRERDDDDEDNANAGEQENRRARRAEVYRVHGRREPPATGPRPHGHRIDNERPQRVNDSPRQSPRYPDRHAQRPRSRSRERTRGGPDANARADAERRNRQHDQAEQAHWEAIARFEAELRQHHADRERARDTQARAEEQERLDVRIRTIEAHLRARQRLLQSTQVRVHYDDADDAGDGPVGAGHDGDDDGGRGDGASFVRRPPVGPFGGGGGGLGSGGAMADPGQTPPPSRREHARRPPSSYEDQRAPVQPRREHERRRGAFGLGRSASTRQAPGLDGGRERDDGLRRRGSERQHRRRGERVVQEGESRGGGGFLRRWF